MNLSALLNILPIVALRDTGEQIYVSPSVRQIGITVEREVENHALPRFLSGEPVPIFQSALSFNGSPLILECEGHRIDSGTVLFLVRRKELEQGSRGVNLEALGEIAAGVAHEINTPLQYITDNTQFLAESVPALLRLVAARSGIDATVDLPFLQEELPKAIEQTVEGLTQVSEIVQALKEFSHQSKDKTSVDINQIVKRAATLSKNEWKYAARLKLDLEAELPPLNAISVELCQTLVNLLVNAGHAIAERRTLEHHEALGEIAVTTALLGDEIQISVTDSGTGIPAQIRSRIFEPFFTTKGVGKGTGQGLTQVRNCIESLHGGSVSVTSVVGSSTTFTLRLPL